MPDLNAVELRALLVSTGLLALGVASRLALHPGAATLAWHPADTTAERSGAAAVLEAVEEGLASEERAARPLSPDERIDLNTAALHEIRRLPGVGPARAAAIVEERRRGGEFRSFADLARVPGIGEATARRIAPHVSLPAGRWGGDTVPAQTLDLNRAQIKELEQITGIGPVLALRIVETRHRLGGFRSVEDLLEVPGIGPRTLQRIRDQVRIRSPASHRAR